MDHSQGCEGGFGFSTSDIQADEAFKRHLQKDPLELRFLVVRAPCHMVIYTHPFIVKWLVFYYTPDIPQCSLPPKGSLLKETAHAPVTPKYQSSGLSASLSDLQLESQMQSLISFLASLVSK